MDIEKLREWLTKRKIAISGLILYISFIIWLCIISRDPYIRLVNTFGWSFNQLWNYWWTIALFPQIIGNLLLYLPVGVLVTFLFKRYQICISTAVGVAISGMVESLQYITARGTLDGDDFINNVIGALLGALLAKYIIVEKDKKTLIFALVILGAYLVLYIRVIWLQMRI